MALSALAFMVVSCQKSSLQEIDSNQFSAVSEQTPIVKKCASFEVLEQQLKAEPRLAERMNAIEDFTTRVT